MATIITTASNQDLTDGTKQVIVKATDPFLYGFGASPTTWFIYDDIDKPVEFGTTYGKVVVKTYKEASTISTVLEV